MKAALFGPSGNPESFYAGGGKASLEMPAWLAKLGLGAYEYSLTRGVNIGEATARAIGDQAAQHGIAMSLHAPYYISLATEEETTAANTMRHLLKSMDAADWLRADRIAFHPGGIGKLDRRGAMELNGVGTGRAVPVERSMVTRLSMLFFVRIAAARSPEARAAVRAWSATSSRTGFR